MYTKRPFKKDQVYDYMVKLIIIGDSGVGKTNILTRFCEDQFKQSHVATIGVDFNIRTIQIDNKRFRLQVWDTAGQQRFKTITETYYRGATGIILAYAVDSQQSFLNIEKWISQVNSKVPSSIKKVLVANKIDIKQREVTRKQGQQMATKYGLQYIETSAKTNEGVQDIFYHLTRMIKDKIQLENQNHTHTITLSSFEKDKQFSKQDTPTLKNSYCKC